MDECENVVMRGTCPDCGSTNFHPGPRGGMAWNVKCAKCGSKFWYSPPFTPHRIDNEDQFYDLTVTKRLSEFGLGPYSAAIDTRECDECGAQIPETEGTGFSSAHAKSCSLHPDNVV